MTPIPCRRFLDCIAIVKLAQISKESVKLPWRHLVLRRYHLDFLRRATMHLGPISSQLEHDKRSEGSRRTGNVVSRIDSVRRSSQALGTDIRRDAYPVVYHSRTVSGHGQRPLGMARYNLDWARQIMERLVGS